MTVKKLGTLLFACLSLAILTSGCQHSRQERRKVTVVATGFLKGSLMPYSREYSRKRTRVLGGYAHLAGRVKELQKNTGGDAGMLLVDLGNHLSGSLEAYVSKGQMVVEMMNKLPYAASLLSNMEFTYGQDVLRARTKQARFPYLSSNVKFQDPSLRERVVPEVIQNVAGLRVAILGYTPENLERICAPDVVKGLAVDQDLAQVVRRAGELKKEGADLVVLLSKISVDAPPQEVKKVLSESPVDLVLGIDYSNDGEAMTTWGRTVVTGLPGDNRGSRVKVVELTFDASRKLIDQNASVEVISPEVNTADADVENVLANFKTTVMAAFQEKVGTVSTVLTRGWREEATLGNLIADGMKSVAGAQLAVINSGAIQDELSAGDCTVKDLFRVVPFDNTILAVNVTGAQLKEALAHGLAQGTTFQVSGMTYRAREDASGTVSLTDLEVGGKPIDPARAYRLATTDFALSRMDTLKGLTPEVRGTVRSVLTQVIRTGSPVERKADGRVQFERLQPLKKASGQ